MNPNFEKGELITILSIDGGGVRGIIPGTVLAVLESKLQVKHKILRSNFLYRNSALSSFLLQKWNFLS